MRPAVLCLLLVTGCGDGRAHGVAGSDGGSGCATSVVGTVFAPNGLDPVPNAIVYVPGGALRDYSGSVACDLCGTVAGAITSTVTRSDGGFTLTGVPAGVNVQIVVELGRFRRVKPMIVQACMANVAPKDPGSFGLRLPGKNRELAPDDHVPNIAVATGDYDQIECVLKRMGISQIDLYDDRSPGSTLPVTVGTFGALLADRNKLKGYNLVIINCTNKQFEQLLTPAVLANLEDYVGSGGRLYATDWAYDFINQVPQFSPYLCFVPGGVDGAPPPAMCSGAPGAAGEAHSTTAWNTVAQIHDPTLQAWLSLFTQTISNNQVPVAYNFVVVNHVGDPAHPTTVWADGDASDPSALPMFGKGVRPLTVTFDYKQCGRVHYSTYNTEPNALPPDSVMFRYPMCDGRTTFYPQERLLEYLIFETAQCVGPIG